MNLEFRVITLLITAGLFAGMLGALALGRRIARWRAKRDDADSETGVGAMNGAIFGLLGLLIAFTFSGAAERFEGRRGLIVEEANAIGTAYLRLDVLHPDARSRLQEKFRRYIDTRLGMYKAGSIEEFRAEQVRAIGAQGEIWSDAVIATREAGGSTPVVLLPALNQMIDITTTRSASHESHPPMVIYVMLIALALLSAVLAGMGMSLSAPNWVPRLAFAAATAGAIYVTIDIEYPRLGFIRIDAADHILRDVRDGMK